MHANIPMCSIHNVNHSPQSVLAVSPTSSHPARGFSLAEVTIALGLVAFALVALFGLLSTALQVSKKSKTELQAAQIAFTLLTTRRAAPLVELAEHPLPPLNQTNSGIRQKWLDRSGRVVSSRNDAYFGVSYEIEPISENTAKVYLAVMRPPLEGANYEPLNKAEESFETTTYVRLK